MAQEIINRVEKSPLVTIDLEDFYPEGTRTVFDISNWLYEGLILKEKDFRESVENHDWRQYQDNYVALTCKTLELLETVIFQEIISTLDITEYKDKPIIIKGCSNKPIPETASTLLVEKLLPTARTIMFGEACSTVPLYKRKK